MSAEEAMTEIWGLLTPDCGPSDYKSFVKEVEHISTSIHPPTRTKCCFVGCESDAAFEIITRRSSTGQRAGPDVYSDDTLSCVKHVGVMLGYQPNTEAVEEIEWLVTQCESANLKPSTA